MCGDKRKGVRIPLLLEPQSKDAFGGRFRGSRKAKLGSHQGRCCATVFQNYFFRYFRIYLLALKQDTPGAFKGFLASTRLEGEMKAMRSENGSDLDGQFGFIIDRHGTKAVYITSSVSDVENYSASSREEAHVLPRDAEIPGRLDLLLWGKRMIWSVDAFNQTCISVNHDFNSSHGIYSGKQSPLRLVSF